jgi:hypothetical protein
MRLLLGKRFLGGKLICQFPSKFSLSGLLLSARTEKSGDFCLQPVDSGRFCGTLTPLTRNLEKALVGTQIRLARFLLKPIGSINVLK